MDKSSLSESQIETLIKMVEERPCIWDKTCNKDSAKKNSAWMEIFEHFSDGTWDDMSPNDRKQMENMYQVKWRNLRDTFVRCTNTGSIYKYHQQLKFLLKNDNLKKRPKISPLSDVSTSNKFCNTNQSPLEEAGPSKETPNGTHKKSSFNPLKRYTTSPLSSIRKKKVVSKIAPAMSSVSPHDNARPPPEVTSANNISSTADLNQAMDDDEAFWASIKPYMKLFSNLDKLEFRKQAYIAVQNILTKSGTSSTASTSQYICGTEVKVEYNVSDSESN